MTIEVSSRPRPRADVVEARIGSTTLLFEPESRRLHSLNTSAALVWQRVDGASTAGEIAAQLGARYAPDRGLVERDVAAVLGRFFMLGLVTIGDEPPVASADAPAGSTETSVDPAGADPICAAVGDGAAGDPDAPDDGRWSWTSGAHQAVGLTFRVRADEATVGAELARVLRSLREDDAEARHTYSVCNQRDRAGSWTVYFDRTPLGTVAAPDAAVALVLWHLNDAVVRHSPDTLFVRAGALQIADQVVLLPATAEAGATTLTTALIRRGLAYVADDLTAIDPAEEHARAFPKAIGLAARAQALFPDLRPPGLPEGAGAGITRWHVDPTMIPKAVIGRGGPVALVVAARHVPGAPTRVEQVTDAEAVRLLLDQTLPFTSLGAAGFQAIVAIARRAPVYRLQYGELDAGCEVVLELARERC